MVERVETDGTSDDAWRRLLYEKYLSSGQARTAGNVASADRHRRPYHDACVRHLLPKDRELAIVDLGCGEGALLRSLSRWGYKDLTGVDHSQEMVEAATSLGTPNVHCAGMQEWIEGHVGQFDVVFLMDVIEHLTRAELFMLLAAVRRALKPDGSLILHTVNAESMFGMRVRYGDLTHEQAYTQQSMTQLMTTIGFKQVQCYEDRPVVHSLFSLLRRVIWDVGTLPIRLLLLAENGHGGAILSQNMLVRSQMSLQRG